MTTLSDQTYKLFIAGSRQATPAMLDTAYRAVQRAKELSWTVIAGDNPLGVDAAVLRACEELEVPIIVIGIAAQARNGAEQYMRCPARNYTGRDRYLADHADRGLFIWDGRSRGTKNGHDYMLSLGKTTHLMTFK
jgi:uncharacterized phage-like protein YoqJ